MAGSGSAPPSNRLGDLARQAKAHLLYARELGVRDASRTSRRHGRGAAIPQPPVAPGPRDGTRQAPRATGRDPESELAVLRDEAIGDCRRCKLAPSRTQIVFGVGNSRAELVFVGEAPGADEDAQGVPFVGAAGQLLTRIIEAMGLRRDDVYIANIIKCRPPGNRNPQPDEIAACEPFLIAQLEIIAPKVICALGTFAAQTLLKTKDPISRLRGRWHAYQGIPLMPTFHPAYLLRNPGEKKVVWADVQSVMTKLGAGPTQRRPAGA
jgi:DNA polymerase